MDESIITEMSAGCYSGYTGCVIGWKNVRSREQIPARSAWGLCEAMDSAGEEESGWNRHISCYPCQQG